MEIKVGSKFNRKYKGGRLVTGTVAWIDKTHIAITLSKDYDGKNEYWGVGETKVLSKKILGIK